MFSFHKLLGCRKVNNLVLGSCQEGRRLSYEELPKLEVQFFFFPKDKIVCQIMSDFHPFSRWIGCSLKTWMDKHASSIKRKVDGDRERKS